MWFLQHEAFRSITMTRHWTEWKSIERVPLGFCQVALTVLWTSLVHLGREKQFKEKTFLYRKTKLWSDQSWKTERLAWENSRKKILTNQKHYQDLGSERHQYEISVLVTQTSFFESSGGNRVKRRLFSQATELPIESPTC